jgi:hypothetical protein
MTPGSYTSTRVADESCWQRVRCLCSPNCHAWRLSLPHGTDAASPPDRDLNDIGLHAECQCKAFFGFRNR